MRTCIHLGFPAPLPPGSEKGSSWEKTRTAVKPHSARVTAAASARGTLGQRTGRCCGIVAGKEGSYNQTGCLVQAPLKYNAMSRIGLEVTINPKTRPGKA